MNEHGVIQFRPPPPRESGDHSTLGQAPSIDAMVEAFTEHCRDSGADFTEYLKPWHAGDALAEINDAAQNYRPELAIPRIKKALGELFEIAAQGHREALEWEGVE